MPMTNEFYYAEKGKGAFKNDQSMSVSNIGNLEECSTSFDSSIRYGREVMLATLGDLADQVFSVRMFGSSVRVLSYIAEGVLDFAVEFHDRPWDFAGGVAIIEEAGGKLTTLRGDKLTHESIGYIVSNSIIHPKVQEIVLKNLSIKK